MTGSIDEYLRYGFIPNYNEASAYLTQLLDKTVAQSSKKPQLAPGDLLCKIIEKLTYSHNSSGIRIPLSGGLDSRALLGASLEVYDRRKILCISVGSDQSTDVQTASEVCKRIGVAHTIIDPNVIDWNPERVRVLVNKHYVTTASLPSIDAMLMYQAIAEEADTSTPLLSGYLGGVVTGCHIPDGENKVRDVEHSVYRFLHRHNPFAQPLTQYESMASTLRDFIMDHKHLAASLPGVVPYDLLDIGWRQRLRIRGITQVSVDQLEPLFPFEEADWIHYWFSQPIKCRNKQIQYREFLRERFPAVFCDIPDRLWKVKLELRLSQSLPIRLIKFARRRFAPVPPRYLLMRGDPYLNHSMNQFLRPLLERFDRIQPVPGVLVSPEWKRIVTDGTGRAWSRVMWAASALFYLEGGQLQQKTEMVPGYIA